ncbi:MAG: response regulator transcription factor [Myxococcota bacterium]|nr:response regulator transcription factor [Myxococcota bacterium]
MESTILLVEDHEMLRNGLRGVVEREGDLRVVAEASDGAGAVQSAREHQPDLVLMDIRLPGISGIDATRQIVEDCPERRVLILSQDEGWGTVEEAFKAGASGYLVKTSSASQLVSAARAVCAGKGYLSPELVDACTTPGRGLGSPLAMLSDREREVLSLIGEGLSSREIAARLGIATRTAAAHRASLMKKLGIHKLAGLVRLAVREGLVEP